MTDRLLGSLLVLVGVAAIAIAGSWDVRFLGDPVGPRGFPLLAGALLAATGGVIALRPGSEPVWPAASRLAAIGLAVAGLVGYGLALRPVGFVPATAAALAGGAVLFGASPLRALIVGILGAVAMWVLIDRALDIPLPPGLLG